MGLGSENETKSQDQIKDMNSHMIIRTKPKKTEQKDLKGKDVFKTVKNLIHIWKERTEDGLTIQKNGVSLDNDIQAYNNKILRNADEQLIS